MDDRRLEQAFRTISQPTQADPAFLARLYEELAAELGFQAPSRTRQEPVHREPRWRPWRLLAAALLAAALVGATVVAGSLLRLWPVPERTSLLMRVLEEGVLTAAIPDEHPQARAPQGPLGGFDIDVVNELARRLGVRPGVLPADPRALASGGDWHIALGLVRGDPAIAERFATSLPIYFWPVHVVVAADSPVASIDGLAGLRVCVVEGSSGASWLTGRHRGSSATPIIVPPDSEALIRPDDEACLDALADGTVAASVTAGIDPAGLAVRGAIRALGGPVLTEERVAALDRQAGDVDTLLAEIDAAIEAARADGTLADLARSRFGGHDLSAPPTYDPMEE